MFSDPRVVVLPSSDLASATTLAIVRSQGYECHALTFRHGQRHEMEVDAASKRENRAIEREEGRDYTCLIPAPRKQKLIRP